jgi:hypothetical protein
MKNVDKFDQLIATVTQKRGKDYGRPEDDFLRAYLIKNQLVDCVDLRMRHVLEMIATKMSRLCANPYHFDSWLDIAGYARTALMVMDSDQEQEVEADGFITDESDLTYRDIRKMAREDGRRLKGEFDAETGS